MSKDITEIELFAGAGGLALGLEEAGIKGLEFVEFDHDACNILRTNRPKWNIIEDDIHNVDFTKYKDKIDIVTGGFPCQSFPDTWEFAGKMSNKYKQIGNAVPVEMARRIGVQIVKTLRGYYNE